MDTKASPNIMILVRIVIMPFFYVYFAKLIISIEVRFSEINLTECRSWCNNKVAPLVSCKLQPRCHGFEVGSILLSVGDRAAYIHKCSLDTCCGNPICGPAFCSCSLDTLKY